MRRDADHATDKAAGSDHGLASRNPLLLAGIHQLATRKRAAGIGKHPRRDEQRRTVGYGVEQLAQRRVLRFQPPGDGLPLEELVTLGAQPLVFRIQGSDSTNRLDRVDHFFHRSRQAIGQRGGNLRYLERNAVDEPGIGLGEHHEGRGESDQNEIAETFEDIGGRQRRTIVRSRSIGRSAGHGDVHQCGRPRRPSDQAALPCWGRGARHFVHGP